MWSKAEKHLEPEEVVEAVIHPSARDIAYLKWHLLALALAVGNAAVLFGWVQVGSLLPAWLERQELWYGFIIPILLVAITEIRRRIRWYHFTDRKVMKETGIFNKHFVTIHYTKITETQLQQPFYKSILGVGDVLLSTAGQDGIEITVSGIRNPEDFKVMIGSKSVVANMPHDAPAPKTENTISPSSLEAELHRIQQRRNDLEHSYSNRQIGKYEYERQWYMLEGEERLVQHFLERIGETDVDSPRQ